MTENFAVKLDPKNEKFLELFPNRLYAYIHDSNSAAMPVIHSEILDLQRQAEGYGIYFTVNGFTGGKRTGETLTNINAFFADIDYPDKINRTPEAVHEYKNEILMELFEEGVPPTAIVGTKNGLHVYWNLRTPIFLNQLNAEQQDQLRLEYRQIEEAILKRFDGDPGAKDVARVLRVPGTLHQKDPADPYLCKLESFAPENMYKFGEIRQAFLVNAPPKEGWVEAQGENPLDAAAKEAIEKEYPKLERPSYKKLFSKEAGSVTEGMRNKALLIAAYAAKEAGWTFEKTCDHFLDFHGLTLREIRKTIRSAFDHQYDFGYNNEVMNVVVGADERAKLSVVTSKVISKATRGVRDAGNEAQKKMYQAYEHTIADRLPDLKHKIEGDFYQYANGVYDRVSQEEIRSIFFREMFEDGLLNYRKISAINDKIAALRSLPDNSFTDAQENPDRNVINLKNGLLDIRTYEMRPHTPDYISTSQIPIAFDREAKAPQWFKFLNDVMKQDQDQIRLLRQIAGYCLTTDTSLAKAFILFGSGANGKSLFTRIVSKIIGERNVSSLSLSTITRQFGLIGLVGKKLNIIDEISGNYFESDVIKGIISGEKLTADVKYRPEPLEFVPFAKILFSVNELPKINDTTPGLYRRFTIVPFEVSFLNNPDTHLESKLSEELPGILNWAIEGLRDLRTEGKFTETNKNKEAMRSFKTENSPISEFFQNMYEVVPDEDRAKFLIPLTEIYGDYRQYCFDSGYKPKAMANFIRELNHTEIVGWDIRKVERASRRYFEGVRRIKALAGEEMFWKEAGKPRPYNG